MLKLFLYFVNNEKKLNLYFVVSKKKRQSKTIKIKHLSIKILNIQSIFNFVYQRIILANF